MALTNEQIKEVRAAIDASQNPIIFFDDDCDGLSSFLMIYNHKKVGKGIPIRKVPEVSFEYAKKVEEQNADLVIILDMPLVSQDFIDAVKTKIIWIDHHKPAEVKATNLHYYNPMTENNKDNRPTSYWTYRIIQDYLWIGMCGMIGDWFMPEDDIRLKFCKEFQDLLPVEIKKPDDAMHNTKIGEMVRVIEFNLKGLTKEMLQSVKVFTRIKSPYEILRQETPAGKFLYKKFFKLEKDYQNALRELKKAQIDDKTFIFTKKATEKVENSFSKQVSNYIIHHHPEKLVLIASEQNGEYICSLRSTKHDLPTILKKAFELGIKGYGGGHTYACGASVKSEDFQKFIEIIKSEA